MRRETLCFSMYSDMSIRTIARSSSNRNSASARASSVLPTPVGPRKMKLASGRFGSCRPARERRIASETSCNANSCPTTRSRRMSLTLYVVRSEEHTSELQSHLNLVCRLLLEKKKQKSELHSHLNTLWCLLMERKKC